MHALWAYSGEEQRLDRCNAPTYTPPSGADLPGGGWVSSASAGRVIRFNTSLTGYPGAPATINDGQGGPSPQLIQVGLRPLYVTAVAFDGTGQMLPSVPVQGVFYGHTSEGNQ